MCIELIFLVALLAGFIGTTIFYAIVWYMMNQEDEK